MGHHSSIPIIYQSWMELGRIACSCLIELIEKYFTVEYLMGLTTRDNLMMLMMLMMLIDKVAPKFHLEI